MRADLVAQLRRHLQRWRFFNQLLMAPLDRALALKQRCHIAVFIGQHLELDVARILDELLHVKFAVAECIRRLGVGRMEKIGQLVGRAHNPHAAPAAAGLGLQNDREPNLLCPLLRLFHGGENAVGAGQNRHLGLLHRLARLFFLAHQPRHFRRRSNELDIRSAANLGEVRVLAQQAVARMNRVDVSDLSGRDHRGHIQIAVAQPRRTNADCLVGKTDVQRIAIGFAIDRDRANAEFLARIQNAQRDFATIGNQNLTKHSYPLSEASSVNIADRSNSAELKRGLPEFDGLAVGDQALDDLAGGVGLDLVHQLHGFDDADHLALFHAIAGRDKSRGAWRRRTVIGADNRRLDQMQACIRIRLRRGGTAGAAACPVADAAGAVCCGAELSRRARSPRPAWAVAAD